MKRIVVVVVLLMLFQPPHAQMASPDIRSFGVKINVTDMATAIDFYVDKLGFTIISGDKTSARVFLSTATGKSEVILNRVRNLLPEMPGEARASFTLQVNDLDSAIANLKSKGVDFGDAVKRKEGVGYAIYCKDPFSTSISLMHQTIVTVPSFREPKIYNYGLLIPDMNAGRNFYKQLGFIEKTERYLPLDMPLYNADSSFAFMLHYRERVEPVMQNSADNEHIVLVFTTSDLRQAKQMLEGKVRFIQKEIQKNNLGSFISFADNSGYISELIERKH